MAHPLVELLGGVARGAPPPSDGLVSVMPPPSPRFSAVLAFTGHHVVAADVSPDWVRERLVGGDVGEPLGPTFLAALCAATGRVMSGTVDAVLVAPGDGPAPAPDLVAEPDPAEVLGPQRDDVRVWTCDGGRLLLGRGLAGRWEVAVAVEPEARNQGLGRALFRAGRHLVPGGEPVWAQVAPGNVSSLRALLEAGFSPAGTEALLVRPR